METIQDITIHCTKLTELILLEKIIELFDLIQCLENYIKLI